MLQVAIANPLVVKIPVIETSEDPTADLRKKIRVEIVKEAYLIRVALELPNAEHAATIINAVVDSYLEYHAEYKHGADSQLKESLTAQLGILQKECESKDPRATGVAPERGCAVTAGHRRSQDPSRDGGQDQGRSGHTL